MTKNIVITTLVALFVSVGAFWTMTQFQEKPLIETRDNLLETDPVTPNPKALFTKDENGNTVPLSFEKVAEDVMNAVVGIRATVNMKADQRYRQLEDPFKEFRRFFDMPVPNQRNQSPNQKSYGSGSGVIISKDGYIVTNNHVVDNSSELLVTLHDNRQYKAELIGTDPTTDLALIKVDATNLDKVSMVNSDDVRVGEWVLAVGNPFNLTSTVTAGIVSAKARNINILDDKYAVESFIQTDAAINKGNSGGALVNMEGGLVGINSAIFSPSGAYSGYGFAIPSNLVNKVVQDLLEYGTVQRGFLGVSIRDINSQLAEEQNLQALRGVYIAGVAADGAADKAGIEEGSVILAIDEVPVMSTPQLQELVARKRPGDELNVTVIKNGREYDKKVVLQNNVGTTGVVLKTSTGKDILNRLGFHVEDVSNQLASKKNIEGGVQITSIDPKGELTKFSKIEEGFIITKVDGYPVNNKEEFLELLAQYENVVMIEGVYPDRNGIYYYSVGLSN